MDEIKLITNALLELRAASKAIETEDDLKMTMKKFNMLFVGEQFNVVYARELYYYMRENSGLSISLDDFLKLIPSVCKMLSMAYEPLVFLNNTSKLADYQITLF